MTSIEDTKTEAAVVAELADLAAESQRVPVAVGEVYLVRDGQGGLYTIDTDEYAATPRHTAAHRTVTDAASFVKYVNRHKTAGTEVYAHTASSAVVAVIDSHEGTDADAGWQKHKLTLALEHTPAWLAWAERDLAKDKHAWFDQQSFAEFIEDRALDVLSPDHGTLIDIATTFEAKQKADFGSAVRLQDGSVKFEYQETVAAKAGQKGELQIPKQFEIAVRPYFGGPIYKLVAQFRYRISGNGLLLGYALERPEVILEKAFEDIVTEIRDGKHEQGEWPDHDGIGDVPIFYGRP